MNLNSWVDIRCCNLDESFVGIQIKNKKLVITFPFGYSLEGKDEFQLKKEVLNLIEILKMFNNSYLNHDGEEAYEKFTTNIPLENMLRLYQDYILNGYYFEKEKKYISSNKGKIKWSRTIQKIAPRIQENEAYYLNFIVQKKNLKQDSIITEIHKYCVYISYKIVGWLIGEVGLNYEYKKYPKTYMLNELYSKLKTTYNDRDKILLKDMISIITMEETLGENNNLFGTNRFEYVWERLIDNIFGISEKKDYFPKTYWDLDGKTKKNVSLEPDTIMIDKEDLIIIDAKYYKYGISKKLKHLPASSDISKQIVYGEYIDSIKNVGEFNIRNLFLLPYNKNKNEFNVDKNFYIFGVGKSMWKNNSNSYEEILGVLVDVEILMNVFLNNKDFAKQELINAIKINNGIH